jgi:hypothetical protein
MNSKYTSLKHSVLLEADIELAAKRYQEMAS